jgi:hypothetical protein
MNLNRKDRPVKSKAFVIAVSLLMVAGSIGCVALSEYVTPADIDQGAVAYATRAGVVEPNDFAGYPNLYKAGMLARAVDDAHAQNQLTMQQSIDKDALNYAQLNDAVRANVVQARQQEELLFGEKGILALGAGLLGAGAFTGILTLMRSRSVTAEQVKQAIAGKNAVLNEQEGQFVELVKAIQKFREQYSGSPANELTKLLSAGQSATTKEHVAIIKANL